MPQQKQQYDSVEMMFEPFDWIIWTVNVWRLIWWLGQFHSNEIVCKRKFIRPLPIYSESIFGNPINHSHSSFAWIWTYIWLCAHSKENIWKFISTECWTTLLLRPKFPMHNGYSVCSLHVILSFSVIKMFVIINVRLWKLILTSCWEKFRTRNELHEAVAGSTEREEFHYFTQRAHRAEVNTIIAHQSLLNFKYLIYISHRMKFIIEHWNDPPLRHSSEHSIAFSINFSQTCHLLLPLCFWASWKAACRCAVHVAHFVGNIQIFPNSVRIATI